MEKNKLNQIIEENYFSPSSIELYRESDDNFLYQIESNQKTFAVRLSKHAKMEDVEFESKLLQTLKDSNTPCETFIRNNKDSFITSTSYGPLVVIEWIKGNSVTLNKVTKPSLDITFDAGKQLAKLHNATKDLQVTGTRNRTMYTELDSFIKQKNVAINFFSNGSDIVNKIEKAIEFAKNNTASNQIIHNDYRASNVMTENDTSINAILDFDWACIGDPLKDLALAVMEWSFPDGDETYEKDRFDAFLNGYISENNDVNLELLPEWMLFAGLSDACTYWSNYILPNTDEKSPEPLNSYMLDKALFFSELKIK